MESVDSHAHVFETSQPLSGDRRYTPVHDARVEQYLARLDANGIGCAVLVQPSFLGTDNSYMCAALRAHPQRLRGIAVVEPGIVTSCCVPRPRRYMAFPSLRWQRDVVAHGGLSGKPQTRSLSPAPWGKLA